MRFTSPYTGISVEDAAKRLHSTSSFEGVGMAVVLGVDEEGVVVWSGDFSWSVTLAPAGGTYLFDFGDQVKRLLKRTVRDYALGRCFGQGDYIPDVVRTWHLVKDDETIINYPIDEIAKLVAP